MSVVISPVGLAAEASTNVANIMATYKENLCRTYCINSTILPLVSVVYSTDTPKLNASTVFVPIKAVITVITLDNKCGCNAHTQLFTENFVIAFLGRTALPTSVTLTNLGRDEYGSNVYCGRANSYTINDSLSITLN